MAKLFAAEMPELDLRIWPEAGNPSDIEAAAVALMPKGKLKDFPNLRLIVSLTAGAEGLLGDPELPDVPIARSGDPDGDAMMNEAALLHVLRHHRHLPAYAAAQQRSEWISLPRLRARDRKVGVMGLGSIGLAAAKTLARHGFNVAGWVRSPRQGDGIEIFAGREQLPAFLSRSEIVVNFLPLTPETTGILDAAAFAQMPQGRRDRQSRARAARERGGSDGRARQRPSCRRDTRCFSGRALAEGEPALAPPQDHHHSACVAQDRAARPRAARRGCDQTPARGRAPACAGRPQARLLICIAAGA